MDVTQGLRSPAFTEMTEKSCTSAGPHVFKTLLKIYPSSVINKKFYSHPSLLYIKS